MSAEGWPCMAASKQPQRRPPRTKLPPVKQCNLGFGRTISLDSAFAMLSQCLSAVPSLERRGQRYLRVGLERSRLVGDTVARLPKATEPVAFASAAASSSDSSLIPPRPSSPSWPASAAAAPVESDVRPASLPSAGHLASITTLSCFPSPWPAIPKAAPDPCQPTGHALLRELHAPPSATPQSREQPS